MIFALLFACNALESNINFLDLALLDGNFYVDVVLTDYQCRDVTSLHDSTLGGQAVGVVNDTRTFSPGSGELQVSEFGVWVDTGGCNGDFGLGFEDVSALAGDEVVTLELTGDRKTHTIELTNWPMAQREVIPDRALVADELWGQTYTFRLDGPGSIDPGCMPRLSGPGETASFDVVDGASWEVTDDQIVVTFPPTNPMSVDPDSIEMVRMWDLDARSPFSYNDAIGEADFYIQHQTTTSAFVDIQAGR